MNLTGTMRKMRGWCPNTVILNKKDEKYIIWYAGIFIGRMKGMRLRGFLGILHMVFGVWLITTALRVMARPVIFPWWFMDINLFSSGILLLVGISSLMIFFNFIRSANVQRKLALANIALLFVFFLYLSQFLISTEFTYSLFDKPYMGYSFGYATLILFTLIISIPSALTIFIKPSGESNKIFLTSILLILIIVLVSLGGYYLYLNMQKDAMLAAELGKKGEYRLYKIEPGSPSYFDEYHPYFLDSPGDTTGHYISEDIYQAIQFLRNKETGTVLSWWDFELEIKAAGKEPVINYASEAIKPTIARPASLYDKFEPDEKVADVSRFFTTESEDTAKAIAEKYGATIVYIPKQRFDVLQSVMMFAADPKQEKDVMTPEQYAEKINKPSIARKFISGTDFKYFEKIFENKDIIIYEIIF